MRNASHLDSICAQYKDRLHMLLNFSRRWSLFFFSFSLSMTLCMTVAYVAAGYKQQRVSFSASIVWRVSDYGSHLPLHLSVAIFYLNHLSMAWAVFLQYLSSFSSPILTPGHLTFLLFISHHILFASRLPELGLQTLLSSS